MIFFNHPINLQTIMVLENTTFRKSQYSCQSFLTVFDHAEVLIASIQALCNARLFLMRQIPFDVLLQEALVDAERGEVLEQVELLLEGGVGGELAPLGLATEHRLLLIVNQNQVIYCRSITTLAVINQPRHKYKK